MNNHQKIKSNKQQNKNKSINSEIYFEGQTNIKNGNLVKASSTQEEKSTGNGKTHKNIRNEVFNRLQTAIIYKGSKKHLSSKNLTPFENKNMEYEIEELDDVYTSSYSSELGS